MQKDNNPAISDVVITGAGPAGVVLALQLHRAGLSVCLLGVPRRFDALEGMAERARKGFEVAACSQALATLGPLVERSASWSGEHFAGNREYLVERQAFDAGLWRDAADAGVAVLPSRVKSVEQTDDGHWCVSHEGGELYGRYWVEARGRSAPRSVQQQRAPATVALAAWWQSEPNAPLAGVHTLPQGWLWYARLNDGRLSAQIFLDAKDTPSRSQLEASYLSHLADSEALRPILESATRIGEPTARGASLTLSEPLIDQHCARVGDAALALDPLAGHGQFEAVGSALALASCLCTLLQRPENTAAALQFYRERMRGDYLSMARNGRDFYALEKHWAAEHFWRSRSRWPDDKPSHPVAEVGVGSVERRPVSADGYIREQWVVVCPDQPRGVWQIDGVPLLALLRQVRNYSLLSPDKVAEFAAACEWPDSSVVRAVHWLGARGLLTLSVPE